MRKWSSLNKFFILIFQIKIGEERLIALSTEPLKIIFPGVSTIPSNMLGATAHSCYKKTQENLCAGLVYIQ